MSLKLIKQNHHREKLSPLCGKIIEILGNGSHEAIDIAMIVDIKPTIGHFHKNFEEIYFVIDAHLLFCSTILKRTT